MIFSFKAHPHTFGTYLMNGYVRAVHEANCMNEIEISTYDSWFDPLISTLPGLIPDGIIYLRDSYDTCHK